MKALVLFILALSLCSSDGLAQEGSFSSKNFKVAIGGEYLSLLAKRGVVTYGSYQIIPIYAVDVFHPDLQIVGSSLNYKMAWDGDKYLVRFRYSHNAAGDRPLYETAEKETQRVRRTRTAEVESFFEYTLLPWAELHFSVSQDISVHRGTHGSFGTRLILGNYWMKGERPMIQPAIFLEGGLASKSHNQYFYGEGARGGLSNYSVGFSVSSPAVIDRFYPVLRVSRAGILGKENRSASFIRSSERSHWQIIALGAFRIW